MLSRGATGVYWIIRTILVGGVAFVLLESFALDLVPGAYAGIWRAGGGFFRVDLVEDTSADLVGSLQFARRSETLDLQSQAILNRSPSGTWSMEWTGSPQGSGQIEALQPINTPFGSALAGHFLGTGKYSDIWSEVVLWKESDIGTMIERLATTESLEIGEPRSVDVRYWTSENGLAGNHVRSFHQTRDGFIWVGTTSGLSRFDGLDFQSFSVESTPRLPDNNVTGLVEDHEGRLVVATKSSGLFRLNEGVFEAAPINEQLRGRWIKNLQVGKDGSLWFILDQETICQVSGWTQYREWFGSAFESGWGRNAGQESSLLGLLKWGPGKIFLWRTRGWMVVDLNRESAVHFALPNRLNDPFDGSTEEGVWLRWRKVLLRFHTDFSVSDVIPVAPEDGEPLLVRESRWGGYWIVTKTKLVRSIPGRESVVYPLPDRFDIPTALREDSERNLWLYDGEHGVCRYRIPMIVSRQSDVAPVAAPNNVKQSVEGEILITSDKGVLNLDTLERQSLLTIPWLDHEGIAMDPMSKGRFWCGLSVPSNLRQWNEPLAEGEFYPVLARGTLGTSGLLPISTSLYPEGIDHIHSIVATEDGTVWLASRPGLLQYVDGEIRNWNLENGFTEFDIFALHLTKNGSLWVGSSENGILELREGRLNQHLRMGDGLTSDSILSFWEDNDGTVWAGGLRGLNVLKDGQLYQTFTGEPFLNQAIQSIVRDREERLWLGTPNGVFVLGSDQFREQTDGNRTQVRGVRMGAWDGLLGDGVREEFHPVSLRARDGSLYFCFPDGLQRINPDDIDTNRPGPNTVLTGCFGARETFLNQVEILDETGRSLPPAAGDLLRFEFTSPHFSSPDRIQFEYRLGGLSDEWTNVGNQRMIWFSRLVPGAYRLEVRGIDRNLRVGLPAALDFAVLPRFYQTWWFQVLVVLFALGLIIGLHRGRLRFAEQANRIREQERLNAERARIARDMHDEIGSSLAQIRMLGELAEKLKDRPREAGQLPLRIANAAHESSRSLREIIWSLNPLKESVRDLGDFMEVIVDSFFASSSTNVTVNIESVPTEGRPLSPQFKREFVLLLKGILSNVVRHANCRHCKLSLAVNEGWLHLSCEDDGVGFDPESIGAASHGLQSIHQRVAHLHGQFVIDSRTERGTRVAVRLPL